ncbi:PLD nuclease N-terminal domain-containing protein [Allostreptomyces psammosilenae]|uniref:Cardiolipin synthase N-terminal domain-containing protein n=1 Tax=Allostreptomyces psammosilenae TaxID=1892865 RepID=A0A852ZYI9_9ACTN|nr:PLD nuclease N-terminal domain-containing protein [Allostreptomyces psammosilenae]NYI05784.1 hypothetical protein [Allostreptomyces psammosilenae]
MRVLLFLATLGVTIFTVVDCIQSEDEEVRGLPKIVWVFLILLFSIPGAAAWFIAGRPRAARPAGAAGFGGGLGRGSRGHRPAPLAPDDDPEFLASLNKRVSSEEQDLLRRWEEDLLSRDEDAPHPDPRSSEAPEDLPNSFFEKDARADGTAPDDEATDDEAPRDAADEDSPEKRRKKDTDGDDGPASS